MKVQRRLSTGSICALLILSTQLDKASAGVSAGGPVWLTEWGGFNSIADIEPLPDGRVFAVGSNLIVGDSIEPGALWRAIDTRDVPAALLSLDLIDGSGWTVGENCIERIKAGSPLGCDPNPLRLHAVALESPSEGWALGQSVEGRQGFVRLSSSTFTYDQDATAGPPQSLWVDRGGDGWATASSGRLYRLSEGTWSVTSTPVTRTLSLVDGLSPNDVWAATGTRPGPPPLTPPTWVVLHYDGVAWTVAEEGSGNGYAAIGMGRGTGYLVEWEGAIRQLVDGTWRPLGVRIPATRFQAVSAVAVLTDGTALVATEAGGVYHVIDGAMETLFEPSSMSGIWLANRQGWAVDGRRALELGLGGRWRPLPEGSALNTLTNIDGIAADSAWGVGRDGKIMRFSGEGWSSVPSPTTVNLTRVRMVSPYLAWAVGSQVTRGTVESVALRFQGATWEVIWERRGNYDTMIIDAAGLAADDPWVVSGNAVWRRQGGVWTRIDSPTAVWSIDLTVDGVWLGGDGELYRSEDNRWILDLVIPAASQIHGLRMRNGLLAAWYGALFQRDAATGIWTRLRGSLDPGADYGVPYALFDAAPTFTSSSTQRQIYAVGSQSSLLLSAIPLVDQATPTEPPRGEQSRLFLPSLQNAP